MGYLFLYKKRINEYILRLMRCGYSYEEATQLCKDFIENLHIYDLQFFVESRERDTYVDSI